MPRGSCIMNLYYLAYGVIHFQVFCDCYCYAGDEFVRDAKALRASTRFANRIYP